MTTEPLSAAQLTGMLRAWKSGDSTALDRLTPIVYAELRRLARISLGTERPGHVLQPSALVNEAYLRLVNTSQMEWDNRAHFFAFAARLMRQILVDFARAQTAVKRGCRPRHVEMEEAQDSAVDTDPSNLIDLNAALEELAKLNSRHAKVVELRYFGGLSVSAVAEVLEVSEDTVLRDWRIARAWLKYRLRSLAPDN